MKIYAHLMDPDMALDHANVLQRMSALVCKSAEDLEFLDATELDQLLELMKPGVPKKKLAKLLNRQ